MGEEDFDIFTNQEEVLEGQKEAAKDLGLDEKVVEDQKRYVAKRNCKKCFGRGFIKIVVSPSKKKVNSVNYSSRGGRKAQKPGEPRMKRFISVYPGNSWGEEWSTRRPEPAGYKEDAAQKFFCSCVRQAV